MKPKFGISKDIRMSGADLYVIIFQVSSLLPLLYIFIAAGYTSILTGRNILSFFFETGIIALPRFETLLLSFVYRNTLKEVVVYFSILVFALIYGIIAGKLFKASYPVARYTRIVLSVIILADMVMRALPIGNYTGFSLGAVFAGTVIRAAGLVLIIMDLSADRKAGKNTQAGEK